MFPALHTNKCTLAKQKKKEKYRIPKIQSKEIKKTNKLKDPNEDASVPLGREKKAITTWDGRRKLRRKAHRGQGCHGEGNQIWYQVKEKD